jgi:peptidoglycan/LPS O-acetylase OafA/YrhL
MTIDVAQKQSGTTPPATTIPARSPHYFPEIDGIRAIAVLIVMFCHAKLIGFTGGFVGVDLFFVISGYVVTLGITRQQDGGQFVLSNFYARRLRRLLPPLYTVALATLAFCLLFSFPENNFKLIKNLGFLILFGSNIYLSRETGYFDLESAKQPLLHTWSLSVEEQFYFLLPLCLVFLRRFRPRTRAIALCGAMLLALAYSITHTAKVGPAGYYFLPARLFEFLFGVVLALAIRRLDAIPRYLADLLVVLGIAAVAYCSLRYGPQTLMPGTNAILPCLAAVLLIVGGRYAGALRPVLSNRPLRYLGRISYPLYLWHWPLIFALNRLGLAQAHWMWGAMGLSLILAALTHHWIELPWRARRERPRRTWLTLWGIPFVAVLAMYLLAKQTENFSVFYPQKYRADYVNAGRYVFDDARARKCFMQPEVSSATDCTLGTPGAPVKAVLWGDSHAYHLLDFVDAIGKAKNITIHDMAYRMCAPVANSPERAGEPVLQSHAEECRARNIEVMRHILSDPQVKVVFMSAIWAIYQGDGRAVGAHGYRDGQIETELAATVSQLNAAGKRVVMLDDTPMLPAELVNCPSDRLYLPRFAHRECSFSRTLAEQQHQFAAGLLGRIMKAYPTTALIDTYYVPCDATRCYAELNGVSLYKHDDAGHLSSGGTRIFYELYIQKHPGQLDQIFGRNDETQR